MITGKEANRRGYHYLKITCDKMGKKKVGANLPNTPNKTTGMEQFFKEGEKGPTRERANKEVMSPTPILTRLDHFTSREGPSGGGEEQNQSTL